MAVAFDAVGPAGGGGTSLTTSPVTWTHTVGSVALPVVLVGVAVGMSSGVSLSTTSVTYAGGSMTPLTSKIPSNNADYGYLQVFGKSGVATGAGTIVATTSGGAAVLSVNCGSLSFANVSQTTPFGTAGTAASNGPMTVTLPSSTIGNMVAGIVGGAPIGAVSGSGTRQYLDNFETESACGNTSGQTLTSTGSSMAVGWTTSDWFAIAALEVLSGATPGPPLTDAPVPVNMPFVVTGRAGRRNAGHSR